MTKLYLHNKEVENVFDLLGSEENDITYSLGWALKSVRPFLNKFVMGISNAKVDVEEIDIMLQQYGEDGGYTDIELLSDDLFCIVEAKKAWNLPGKRQLEKYIARFKEYPDVQHRLVVISECKKPYAQRELKKHGLRLPVEFIAWAEVHNWVKDIRHKCNFKEKVILDELDTYFKKVITMQDKDSNEVFCVVVSDEKLVGDFTFLDVVKKGFYFYPIRGRWPKMPPTYIAFRSKGRLLSVHYVKRYDIVEKPDKYIPEIKGWKKWSKSLHYMLKLGKPFRPDHEVLNGKIYASQHIRCMLDTLFTCKTIQEARDLTNKRKSK